METVEVDVYPCFCCVAPSLAGAMSLRSKAWSTHLALDSWGQGVLYVPHATL